RPRHAGAVPRQRRRLPGRAGRRHARERAGDQRPHAPGGREGQPRHRRDQSLVPAVSESPQHRMPLLHWLLGLPALLTVAVFIAAPYLTIVTMSVRNPSNTQVYAPGFTLQNYLRIVGDRLYLGLLVDTLLYAAITAAICLVLAYPTAMHLARTRSRMR